MKHINKLTIILLTAVVASAIAGISATGALQVTLPELTVTGVTPNNSSARIFYNPVAGAKDYRVYDITTPTDVKYAGLAHYVPADNCPGLYCLHHFATNADGSVTFPYRIINDNTVGILPNVLDVPANDIEYNGLGNRQPHTLIVEAVDSLGPVPLANLYTGPPNGVNNPLAPGGMLGSNKGQTDDGNLSTNGQGPSTNAPKVIARSQPFIVQADANIAPIPSESTATQPFIDTFEQTEATTVLQTSRNDGADPVGNLGAMVYTLNAGTPKAWTIEYRQADNLNSMPFIASAHFMDMLFDGATPGSGAPSHTIYGSMSMSPQQTVDMATGGVLHMTMEVDAHQSFRRWLAFDIAPAVSPLVAWQADQHQIGSANQGLFFETLAHQCKLNIYNGGASGPPPAAFTANCNSEAMYLPADTMEGGRGLDDRSRMDIFVSQTHLAAFQDNKLYFETDIPAGAMPWFNQALKAYYTHYVYHTDADIFDLTQFQLSGGGFCFPLNSYWFNNPVSGSAASSNSCNTPYPAGYGFPYSDERHWDNMGFEVLPSPPGTDYTVFSPLVQLPPAQPPMFAGTPPTLTPPSVTPTQLPATPTSTSTLVPTSTPVPATTVPPTTVPTTVIPATSTPTPTRVVTATAVPTRTPTVTCEVRTQVRLNGVERPISAYQRC